MSNMQVLGEVCDQMVAVCGEEMMQGGEFTCENVDCDKSQIE